MINSIAGIQDAKPFLKWAGGKGQLIPAIEAALPKELLVKKVVTYIEPFIGSGAVLFWIIKTYPNIQNAVINDINEDLVKAYTAIKHEPEKLIQVLQKIQADYFRLNSEEDRKLFFLVKRSFFNSRHLNELDNTALLIFLNRTCFNGLYRVNSSNEFNVPFGKYTNPKICDEKTIIADSKLLQRVTILHGDYKETMKYTTKNTFFYFDPPYKPISKTSSFNSYAKDTFDDAEQVRLKAFCDELSSKDIRWLLSNSDPKNVDPADNFFDDLYSSSSHFIDRIKARRAINSNATKRGEIFEILISNYPKNSRLI
jgi:DNA adenine methylase